MTKRTLVLGIALMIGAGWMSLGVRDLSAQVKQGKTRPLRTSTLMKCLVQPNCGSLKKALDANPADDKAWDTAALHAELLNEAGHALMADGRCPDAEWAGAAKALQEASAAVTKAIAEKNADGAKEAFGNLTKACGACHKAHKK